MRRLWARSRLLRGAKHWPLGPRPPIGWSHRCAPYCAVGCGQLVYLKDDKIIDIEGDPLSPISNGCLCPKGAATFQLVTGSHRVHQVMYRRPHGTEWEQIPLERAMDMVADRVRKTRDAHWEDARTKVTEPAAPWQSPIWAEPLSTTKRII